MCLMRRLVNLLIPFKLWTKNTEQTTKIYLRKPILVASDYSRFPTLYKNPESNKKIW